MKKSAPNSAWCGVICRWQEHLTPFKAWLSALAVGYGMADKADLRPRRKIRAANGCVLGFKPGFRGYSVS